MRYVVFRNPFAFLRANWRFRRIVRDFRPTHIHAFNQLFVLNFLIGLTFSRIPMIFRAGDEPTVHNWIWRMIWKFVVWRTDMFVANSRFVMQSLVRHGVPEARVTLIYNTPPNRRPTAPLKLPFPEADCLIAYVGQVSEHKGVHVLLEAFRLLAPDYPNAQLVIGGRISDWSGDAWARQLRTDIDNDTAIRERVMLLGEIEDVPGLLSRSRVHVVPSLFDDPSPNVVMEAKRAACPSIVFPRGGMRELVTDGTDGSVCSDVTAISLADALRPYLTDAALAKRHGQAARRSLSTLGVHEFAQRWLQVCDAVVRERGVPGQLDEVPGARRNTCNS